VDQSQGEAAYRAPVSTMSGVAPVTEQEAGTTYNSVRKSLEIADGMQQQEDIDAHEAYGAPDELTDRDIAQASRRTRPPVAGSTTAPALASKVGKGKGQDPDKPNFFQSVGSQLFGMGRSAAGAGYRGPMGGGYYRSDAQAKIPSFGPVGGALSRELGFGARDTSYELGTDGQGRVGMDVMGTLKKAAHVPDKIATGIPTGISMGAGPYVASGMMGKVPMGSGMVQKVPMGSGMVQKVPVSDEQAKQPTGVMPLYEPEGAQLHVGEDGLGRLVSSAPQDQEQARNTVALLQALATLPPPIQQTLKWDEIVRMLMESLGQNPDRLMSPPPPPGMGPGMGLMGEEQAPPGQETPIGAPQPIG